MLIICKMKNNKNDLPKWIKVPKRNKIKLDFHILFRYAQQQLTVPFRIWWLPCKMSEWVADRKWADNMYTGTRIYYIAKWIASMWSEQQKNECK